MINATLHASYPPSVSGHICDWAVTSVTGEPPNSLEFSQWLESLPSRIETVSLLNTMAFQHIMKVLVALWMVGLWCRLRKVSSRGRAYGGSIIMARERFLLDAGLVFALCCLANNGKLKSCVAVIIYWAIMCGGWSDALTMLVVFSLACNNCIVTGICLSVAYTSWAVVRLIAPWKNQHSGLPSYEVFRASLRPVKKSKKQGRAGKEEEECIICWSSDELPLRLPCRRAHMICAECLDRLQDSDQNRCPLCRLQLYAMESAHGEMSEFLIACFAASCAIGTVFVALTCYKESCFWATLVVLLTASITLPTLWDVWQFLGVSHALDDVDLEDWDVYMIMRHGFLAVGFTSWSVYRIWKSDRVTFVDGVLFRDLEVWMGHSFFWES